MNKWILPTISEVINQGKREQLPIDRGLSLANSHKAQRQWCAAIATLSELLEQVTDSADLPLGETSELALSPVKGLIVSGPLPILSHPEFSTHFTNWLFTVDGFNSIHKQFQLPPAEKAASQQQNAFLPLGTENWLPLSAEDPLQTELFCLVLTQNWSLAVVVGENAAGEALFQFTFDPDEIEQCCQALRSRLQLAGHADGLRQFETDCQQFAPKSPDYRIVTEFTRRLLHHLTEEKPLKDRASEVNCKSQPVSRKQRSADTPDHSVELLQAIAHEVKTPLTTIRTLIRLLLKRRDLPTIVVDRLRTIDRECTEQIDRFGLIFRAVEMETNKTEGDRNYRAPVHLTPTSLSQVFQQSIPRWQKQAGRRNLTLDVVLPQKMPAVVSDPTMLDQVLTGLIENFTSTLPTGSHVKVQVTPAGSQLKLQFHSQPQDAKVTSTSGKPALKSLGQLLMFQPETGNLSLNMSVTKNLFEAIGGKLIVRQRPQQGEVLTIFLPMNLKEIE